jgi:hypothetical protein
MEKGEGDNMSKALKRFVDNLRDLRERAKKEVSSPRESTEGKEVGDIQDILLYQSSMTPKEKEVQE